MLRGKTRRGALWNIYAHTLSGSWESAHQLIMCSYHVCPAFDGAASGRHHTPHEGIGVRRSSYVVSSVRDWSVGGPRHLLSANGLLLGVMPYYSDLLTSLHVYGARKNIVATTAVRGQESAPNCSIFSSWRSTVEVIRSRSHEPRYRHVARLS